MAPGWREITAWLSAECAPIGLDLVQPLHLGRYNLTVPEALRVEEGNADRLGVLLGNSRALWGPLCAAVRADAELSGHTDPLEHYLITRLPPLLERAPQRLLRLYWAHDLVPRALPIQRLAEHAGLASLSPSHLCIHPVHGPWIALRALLVFDCEAPEEPEPTLQSPCPACHKPCLPALERALEASGPQPDMRAVALHAERFIAVRDACPVGRASRYEPAQLRYHYEKDRKLLR
jgi:methylmalonic aciduria homocystinuria type C protein